MITKTELEKLLALLPHWIEHNHNHKAEYRKWAEMARHGGLEEAAAFIEKAIVHIGEADDALTLALAKINRAMPGKMDRESYD